MRSSSRGQSTVEFALIFPLLVVTLFIVVQVVVIAYTQLSVTFAAREAVRIVAVDPAASLSEAPGQEHFEYVVEPRTSRTIEVSVSTEIVSVSPLFDPLLEGRILEASAVAVVES